MINKIPNSNQFGTHNKISSTHSANDPEKGEDPFARKPGTRIFDAIPKPIKRAYASRDSMPNRVADVDTAVKLGIAGAGSAAWSGALFWTVPGAWSIAKEIMNKPDASMLDTHVKAPLIGALSLCNMTTGVAMGISAAVLLKNAYEEYQQATSPVPNKAGTD